MDDFNEQVQRMADVGAKKSSKAAPKGMAKAPGGSEAIFKPDEARQAEMPYSHEALIGVAVANPGWGTVKLAQFFGQTPGWLSSVVASDEFQLQLDPVRKQVKQTFLTATLEERFRGLTLRSMEVLQERLDNPNVQDTTVLKAAELGIKALGLGKPAGEEDNKPKVNALDKLAQMLEANLAAKGGNMIAPRAGQGGLDQDDDETEVIDA